VGLKIAVVGAGSTYTPELVEGLATRADRLPVDELALFDVDGERLSVVGGLAGRMLARVGWGGRLHATGRREEAIDGADFVVVQLRVGGQAMRLVDETLPLEFGCVGQETTGPGGFAKALRTVPVVLELASETARRAAPGAWFVDFTNPVGIVTQALLDRGHRAVGLCNSAIGFQRRFAGLLGVAPDRVELEHVGLNHLTWERAVRVDGADRLPELLEDHGAELAGDLGLPVALLQDLRTVPSSYLRYYYATSQVLEEQRRRPTRAAEVAEIERGLLELYSEAAAALVASLHAGSGDTQVVDVRNDGALPGLPDDAVVEVPARIDADGAHPLPLAPLAPELLGLVQQAKAYERLAVEAAVTGERSVARKALLANPLVGDYRVAAPLLDALLEASRPYLPRFFPGP
jgi:6-phospho-beta-glucosidase